MKRGFQICRKHGIPKKICPCGYGTKAPPPLETVLPEYADHELICLPVELVQQLSKEANMRIAAALLRYDIKPRYRGTHLKFRLVGADPCRQSTLDS